ncbi:MAG: hypothetical protein EXR72_25355 [Myxococcales bacterium]|nr:hypothetical protein [Myxococcales bacterium]
MIRPRLCAAVLVMLPSLAGGVDIPCGPVEPDVIRVDGLLDDWEGAAGIDVGGRATDLSFTVRCNYDAKTLYLAVDVRDDYLVRTKEGRASEDHLELAFADGEKVDRLVIYPADPAAKAKHGVRWSSGRSVKGIEVAEARQPAGWAVEVRMALAGVPGWTAGAPRLKLGVAVSDCDSKGKPTVEATLSSSPLDTVATLGVTEFPEASAALAALLRDLHASDGDVVFDRTAAGGARVVIVGRHLAVVSDEYSYVALPFKDRGDLLEVRLIDLAGDGREAVVVRYRERSGAGTREVLAAWRMTGDGLRRTFGVEVGKVLGEKRLEATVSFVRKGRATEIVVEPKPAVGWTAATYREARTEDLVPIPLPWATAKRARFQFRGDNYLRAD